MTRKLARGGPAAVSPEKPLGREAILQAALRLFAENGIDGVSMREIAAEAGVSLGLIWKCFGPKEALRAAVDDHVIGVLDRDIQQWIGSKAATLDQAFAFDDQHLVSGEALELRYLRRAMLEGGDASMKMFNRYFEVESAFFAHLIASGEIRADIDADMLTMTSIYIGLGPLLLEPYAKSVFGKDILDPGIHARRREFLTQLFTRGLAPAR